MLIDALTDHFQSYFNRAEHHDTILWFDPEEEYATLLDHLTALPLWRYEGSLLQVRYRLIHRTPGERVVVYLPLSQKEAEVLRPFFATSLVFRERLYRFLRRQGLDFPDDPQVAHELRVSNSHYGSSLLCDGQRSPDRALSASVRRPSANDDRFKMRIADYASSCLGWLPAR